MPKTCPICQTTYPDSNAFCPTDGTTLRADETDADLIGSVIADRYLISKLLGEGGMGRVYLAGHVRLPQQAAIKVLHPSMVQDSAAVARFNREAANAVRIEHDRVARIFDFGETSNGLVFIAMEFVPGTTLRAILEEQTRLSPARAANLIFQVAEGLDAAHRMSIVHRDLKPDNIMVITDDAGIDRAKVVDFGIAKMVDGAAAPRTQLTQAGSVIGTPEFMSPEQVFGEPLDARSDVYALALVGYQMFTGLLPFDSSTPERSLTARIVSDPRTLAEGMPEVGWPVELQAAFDRALAREPDTRTASALEFADAVVAATEAWIGTPVLRTRTPLSNPLVSGATPLSSPTVAGAAAGASGGGAAVASGGRAVAPAPAPVAAKDVARAAASGPATAAHAVGASVAPTAAKGASRGLLFGGIGAVAVAAVAFVVFKSGALGGGSGDTPAGGAEAQEASAPGGAGNGSSAKFADSLVGRSLPAGGSRPVTGGVTAANGQVPPSGGPPSTPAASNGATGDAATNAAANAASSTDGDEALREFEGIKKAMADADDDQLASVGRDAVPRLQRLLGRMTSRADSMWVNVYLVNAFGMADQPARACAPLREVKRLANSEAQLKIWAELSSNSAFTCSP